MFLSSPLFYAIFNHISRYLSMLVRTNNVSAIISQKYTRRNWSLLPQNRELLNRVNTCVQNALKRKPVKVEMMCQFADIRAAFLGKGKGKIPFICATPNGEDKCYLGIFPNSCEGAQALKGDAVFERHKHVFEAHMFTDKELAIMDTALPHLEPDLCDTRYFYSFSGEKLDTHSWVTELSLQDILYYMAKIHPMITEEMENLALNPGDLVFDPACGHGTLLKAMSTCFPNLRFAGSDINQEMVALARQLNPDLHIYKADAIESLQLGLEINSVDLLVFSGLINQSVVTRQEAEQIMRQFSCFSKDYGYIIATGKTLPWFGSEDPYMLGLGLWNLVCTKWADHNFYPFYVWLTPRKIWTGENRLELIPIAGELAAGPGVALE